MIVLDIAWPKKKTEIEKMITNENSQRNRRKFSIFIRISFVQFLYLLV